jgi:voltage-gated sodium channel
MAEVGSVLIAIDRTILAIFVLEIVLRLVAYGLAFFRDPWNVFDFAVVGIALIPASGPFSVLRALRIVRVLRLISVVPRMRRVVGALLGAIPSMGSIIALLSLLMYVGAVMATKLYGSSFPELFGSLPDSLFSLFQIMTLEGWSDGIVRPVMETYPFAWLFFIPFILIATFIMLNLFIAVIVNAMQMQHEQEAEAKHAAADQEAHAERELMLAEVRAIRKDLGDLRADLERRRPS